MSTISITDVGPIERLDLSVDGPGGVIVLRGRNGAGKSSALRAVQALQDPAVARTLTTRDGATSGSVEGLGVQLRLGRRNSSTGELEVQMLDGADPSTLVDPGLKDQAAADERRIQVLCKLARVRAEPAQFAALLGTYAEKLLDVDWPTDDLPAYAGKVRRAAQAKAREIELEAEAVGGKGAGVMATVGAAPTNLPTVEAARAATHAALVQLEQARADVRRCAEGAAQQRAHMDQLAALQAAAPDVDALRARVAQAQAGHAAAQQAEAEAAALRNDAHRDVEALKRQLEDAQRTLTSRQDALLRATQAKEQAAQAQAQAALDAEAADGYSAKLAAARELAEQPMQAGPSPELLAKLEADYTAAQQVQEAAAVEATNATKRNEASVLLAQARQLDRDADELRRAAKAVDDVVSAAIQRVAPRGISVRDSRLWVETPRGKVLLADLSSGERWRLALDVAIDAVGEGGMLAVPQEAWEGLDPSNRVLVQQHCRARHTWLCTAACDDGELRAEVYDAPAQEGGAQ